MEAATTIKEKTKTMFRSAQSGGMGEIGAGGDITHPIDTMAEEIVIRRLQDERIPCVLVSEEAGTRPLNGGGDDYVVLDPIDGTTNAVRHIPFYSTSIAHATGPHLSNVDAGLVMDLHNGTTFSAKKGEGARMNGVETTVSKTTEVEEAIISIELTHLGRVRNVARTLLPLMERSLKLRLLGSTALETAYVASGALDAFIDIRGLTRAVDLAAAAVIVREAGGFIVTPKGEKLDMMLTAPARTSFVASANRQLTAQIIELLKTASAET